MSIRLTIKALGFESNGILLQSFDAKKNLCNIREIKITPVTLTKIISNLSIFLGSLSPVLD